MNFSKLLFTYLFILDFITHDPIYGWVILSSTKSTTSPTTCRIKQNDVAYTSRNQHSLMIPSRHNMIRHRRGYNSLIQRNVLAEDISDINNIVLSKHNNATTTTTTTTTNTINNLYETLLLWFQGDFDNYRQVVIDRSIGLLPREYGGHEHIHCSLIPVSYHSRLAAFYFDGIPNAIFRFRFYNLQQSIYNNQPTVDTILYTLSNDLERKLRTCTDPMMWPEIFKYHVFEQSGVNERKSDEQQYDDDIVELAIQSKCITLLPNCDVRWSWERDAIQHSYVFEEEHSNSNNNNNNNDSSATNNCGIHAVMVHGEALVDSQMIPGQKILIKDQLSLWEDQLWIHDRGFHPDTGAYIYGNQNEVPYRMQRVSYIQQYNDTVATNIDTNNSNNNNNSKNNSFQQQRYEIVISDPEIAWTLGNNYRTQDEYDSNMKRIGGSSRK